MTPEELNKFIEALPAEEKVRQIEVGQQFSSSDTLNQADKTLNALAIEGYAALLAAHGFGAKDTSRLVALRTALEAAGGRRDSAQTGKKTTNKTYQDALATAKKTRNKAVSILGTALDELRKVSSEEAKAARDTIAAVLTNTKSVGADARSLAGQLEQFQSLLQDDKTVSNATADRGGPKLLEDLLKQSKDLRAVSPTKQTTRGTPQETERMDLLDGLIIELTRSARKASRSAANETGQEAIIAAFELDALYRSSNQSKLNAKQREKANLILKTLAERAIVVSKESEEKINNTKDATLLDRWLTLAASVSSAEALFA